MNPLYSNIIYPDVLPKLWHDISTSDRRLLDIVGMHLTFGALMQFLMCYFKVQGMLAPSPTLWVHIRLSRHHPPLQFQVSQSAASLEDALPALRRGIGFPLYPTISLILQLFGQECCPLRCSETIYGLLHLFIHSNSFSNFQQCCCLPTRFWPPGLASAFSNALRPYVALPSSFRLLPFRATALSRCVAFSRSSSLCCVSVTGSSLFPTGFFEDKRLLTTSVNL